MPECTRMFVFAPLLWALSLLMAAPAMANPYAGKVHGN